MATLYGLGAAFGLNVVEHEQLVERSPFVNDWVFDAIDAFSPSETEATGVVDGIAIRATQMTGGAVTLRASLPFPLDAGLAISRERGARPGEVALERAGLTLRCDEPARFGPEWTSILDLAAAGGAHLHVTVFDTAVVAVAADPEVEEVRDLVALAKAVERAATTMPMATRTTPHRAAWSALAADRSWSFRVVPLAIEGKAGSTSLRAIVRRGENAVFTLHVHATYKTRLQQWIRVEDVSGDYADPIVVTGGADCQGALPAEARETLRRFARVGHVAMDDRGLRVRVPLPESPPDGTAIIEATLDIAASSWEFATGEKIVRSPYR